MSLWAYTWETTQLVIPDWNPEVTNLARAMVRACRELNDVRAMFQNAARQAQAIPGKAIGKHRHLLHLPVPFAAQDGAGPKLGGMSA
jgi:hypothetical protein